MSYPEDLRRHAHLPQGRELWLTSLYGLMVLGMGNGCLVYAELWIPSGLPTIMITLSPFWMVGTESLLPGGERLRVSTIVGVLIGGHCLALPVCQPGCGGGEAVRGQPFRSSTFAPSAPPTIGTSVKTRKSRTSAETSTTPIPAGLSITASI
jgi:hypothetical protein